MSRSRSGSNTDGGDGVGNKKKKRQRRRGYRRRSTTTEGRGKGQTRNRNQSRGRSASRRKRRKHRPFDDSNLTDAEKLAAAAKAFHVRETFDKSVSAQVKQLCSSEGCGIDDPDLENLVHLPFITVDNDNSMDLDQAMHIEKTPSGGYVLRYALADGCFYVKPGTPLFKSAVKRGGVSIYTPNKCYPMLPRALSEDIMSLNEGKTRRSLVFCIALDEKGNVTSTTVSWATIKSRWKGSYSKVQRVYDGDESDEIRALRSSDFFQTIQLLKEVGSTRRKIAKQRNVVEFNREGCGIGYNKEGKMEFQLRERYKSELYNEQVSLLCNSEGAKLLHDLSKQSSDVQPIYRNQGAPRAAQIETLEKIIGQVVRENNLDEKTWDWRSNSGVHLGEYLKTIYYAARKPGAHKDAPLIVKAIERQAMLTNVAARFEANKKGHFALKMDAYARFSSPMRELIGCFTHKELREGMFGASGSNADDAKTRSAIIAAANHSKKKQKRLSGAAFKLAMDNEFLPQLKRVPRRRKTYGGIIIGIDFSSRGSKKCYVRLSEPVGAMVKVYVQDLDKHYGVKYKAKYDVFGFYGTTSAIVPSEAAEGAARRAPQFAIAQRVRLRIADHASYYEDSSRDRYVFYLLPFGSAK